MLHSFVLDTSEIKERHTSENLFKHIDNVLRDWGIQTHSQAITVNYNNTNANDIYADEVEDEVDFLRDEHFYGDEEMSQMFESQTQIDENLLNQIGTSSRSHEHNVINPEIVFISDNAFDISKTLKVYGQFQWLGCASHNLNLVVSQGFKKNNLLLGF